LELADALVSGFLAGVVAFLWSHLYPEFEIRECFGEKLLPICDLTRDVDGLQKMMSYKSVHHYNSQLSMLWRNPV
jgi:hypothetical protein